MIRIEEYIILSKQERQTHLRLNEQCIERGCNSEQCRGLLAYVLDTTVPKGLKIHACHACHNSKCNHPFHLYWGTPSENANDAIANGRKSIYEYTMIKHGINCKEIVYGHRQSTLKRRWIYNSEEQTVKLAFEDEIEACIQAGWKFGRKEDKRDKKNSQFGTVWIKKNGKEQKIRCNDLSIFLLDGWIRGRTNLPQGWSNVGSASS